MLVAEVSLEEGAEASSIRLREAVEGEVLMRKCIISARTAGTSGSEFVADFES